MGKDDSGSKGNHWAVFVSNTSNTDLIVSQLMSESGHANFKQLVGKRGALFSTEVLKRYIMEEEKHDVFILTKKEGRQLKSMSSGEQKKILLDFLLRQKPAFLILDNPFENLDSEARINLVNVLVDLSVSTSIIQFVGRKEDILPIDFELMSLHEKVLIGHEHMRDYEASIAHKGERFSGVVPGPLISFNCSLEVLIKLRDVSVAYEEDKILDKINWEIKAGEFWQLKGKNGSGKTTLLSLITGDNVKGYGQDLTIFGVKKGSGESVWDLKKSIGYFTPSMTTMFSRSNTVEEMVLSGFFDSIGLYVVPSDQQIALAIKWLKLIHMEDLRGLPFKELSVGEQRIVMVIRAMIKHPPLLILDEPTSGLDDASAAMLVSLINKLAKESKTAMLYVSHREEAGLEPEYIYELQMAKEGSKGAVLVS